MPWNRDVTVWVCTLVLLFAGSGCELRERPDSSGGADLDTVRARPAGPPATEEELGQVFAPAEEGALQVGDEFWAGAGTVGYELVGEFLTEEALRSSLDPELAIGSFGDRVWSLHDILVAVDYRGSGPVAAWRVVGPAEVVDAYVERLRGTVADRSPLRDLGVLPLTVRYCCETDAPAPSPDR